MNRNKQQSNQYDKIIKENLELTLPVIVREVLGLNIVRSEELPDDIQHTKERKPDALKRVTDSEGNTYVLHVEFQVKDEKEMVYRMAEYSIMLLRKYRLPIQQHIIFLKDRAPAMPLQINTDHHKYRCHLVRISQVSYKMFLKSDNPEVKMLALLGDFDGEESYIVIEKIVKEVQSFTKGDFAESRYFKQLRIFVQLRNDVARKFEKVMQTISKFFKEEKDFLYRRGEEKKSYELARNLILQTDFGDKKIAELVAVPIEFVQKIRTEITEKNKK